MNKKIRKQTPYSSVDRYIAKKSRRSFFEIMKINTLLDIFLRLEFGHFLKFGATIIQNVKISYTIICSVIKILTRSHADEQSRMLYMGYCC